MPKELWRSDYTGHVSAGRETALFRVEATISDENARGSDGRPLWMRISKTSDARKLAGALAQWADDRDAWEGRAVPRSSCTACERELWFDDAVWVDPFGNTSCVKRRGHQPHTPTV